MKVEDTKEEPQAEEMPPQPTEQPETETPETGENDKVKQYVDRFSPGADISTPEAQVQALLGLLDKMVPAYDKFMDVALVSNEAAGFLADLVETGDVADALAGNFSLEEIQAAYEEAEEGGHEKAKKKFSSKLAETKKRHESIKKNMEMSLKDIAEFEEDHKDWAPEKAEAFEKHVLKIIEDGNSGLIAKDTLLALEKGFKYDDDVANAHETGRVAGRNEKIVTQKPSKEKTDALLPEANAGISSEAKPKPKAILEPRKEFRV